VRSLVRIGLIVFLGVSPSFVSAAVMPESVSTQPGGGYVPGEVLVKFKSETPAVIEQGVHAAMGAVRKRELGLRGGRVTQVRLPHGMTVEEGVTRYRNNANVEYAEPNYLRHTLVVPNDTRFGELWGLNNTGQPVNGVHGTADADIDAPEAWDVTTGSSNVVVAVVDSGVDRSHPDLAANIWTNAGEVPGNGVDDDGNGFIDDVHGWDFVDNDNDPNAEDDISHGTHVSGTIAAVGNNSVGVTGVMWTAQIMPVRFIDAMGEGGLAEEVMAIQYAIDNGAKIINASFGGAGFSLTEYNEIAAANAAGLLLVAAAGNEKANNDAIPSYPASYDVSHVVQGISHPGLPNIIAVAATTQTDALASFSNYGITSVHLGAPGTNILSTVNMPTVGYAFYQGTSMATPHVTGVAGLVASVDPSLTPAEIRRAIVNSVDKKSLLASKVLSGGRLNAFGAVQYPTGADLEVTQVVVPKPVPPGDDVTLTLTVTNLGLQPAANVTVTDTLPTGLTYVSATPVPGSCSGTSTINCDLGTLAEDAVAVVTIVATTTTAGSFDNTADVSGSTPDPIPANNNSILTIKVGTSGGGGCGAVKSRMPSPPGEALLFLAVLFSPLLVALARRRRNTIRTRPVQVPERVLIS
jgi:large repetitive protein